MIQRSNPVPYVEALEMDLKDLIRAAKASEYEEGLDLDNLSGIMNRKFLFMDMYDRGYITEDPTGERVRPVTARNMPVDYMGDKVFAAQNAAVDAIYSNGVAIAYPMMGDSDFGPYLAVRTFNTFDDAGKLVKKLGHLAHIAVCAISDVMEIEVGMGDDEFVSLDSNRVVDSDGRSAAIFGFSPR